MIPSASISKDTSICGVPLGPGGIPSSIKFPNILLSFVMARSPSNTWIFTPGWLSSYVENVCDFLLGIVVFLSIKRVNTPPAVSIPSDRGATSNNSKSLVLSPFSVSPDKIAACTDAP